VEDMLISLREAFSWGKEENKINLKNLKTDAHMKHEHD
jgi:hypothetical protein